MKPPRVLLADDHAIVVDGLRRVLESRFDVVGSVDNGRALVEAAKKHAADIYVVDISMPLLNGIEAVRRIVASDPETKVVMLTMYPDVAYATAAFEAGALGYVVKSAAATELVAALDAVLAGRAYISPTISRQVLDLITARSEPTAMRAPRLSSRQREIVQLVAEGHTARQIADLLHISPKTVEYHKYRAMRDLGLDSTDELKTYARETGLVR